MNMGQTEWKYRRDLAPKIKWVKTTGQVKFKGVEPHDKQMLKKLKAGENHWEKLSLDQLEELKQWALEKREYIWTDNRNAESYYSYPQYMIALEPNIKLSGRFRGKKNTLCRRQFNIEEHLHTRTTTYNWDYTHAEVKTTVSVYRGLLDYIDDRLEQGEDSVFKANVAERVRLMNVMYEKNVQARGKVGIPEEQATKSYILKQMLETVKSEAIGGSQSFTRSNYTRGLDREYDERTYSESFVLRVTPKTDEEIADALYDAVKWTRHDAIGFSDEVEEFAKDIIIKQHLTDYTNRIRLQEEASQNWCEVMTQLETTLEEMLDGVEESWKI